MHWQYSPYIIPLLISALMAAVLARLAWRCRPASGAIPLAFLSLAVCEWSLGYVLGMGSVDLAAKVFWAKVQYFGIVAVPPMWLVFALRYTNRERWLTRRNGVLLAITPLLMLLMVWTNDSHGLIWNSIKLGTVGSTTVLHLTYGAFFWVWIAFSYTLYLLGSGLLLHVLASSPSMYRRQALALLIGVLAPVGGNVLHISGQSPLPQIDLTNVGFSVSGLALFWALFRFRLLDIVPVARDTVIECMNDGLIVLDRQNRIVDLNPAAGRIIGRPVSQTIGRSAAKVLSRWPILFERHRDARDAHAEVILDVGVAQRHFNLRISPLQHQSGRVTGRAVVVHDITERKQAERELREHGQFLALLNDITRTALEAPNLQTMLQTLADRMGEVIGADGCYLTLWDRATRTAIPAAAYGASRETYPSLDVEPGEATMTESVLSAGHTLVAEDVYNTPYVSQRIASLFPDRSLLGLPLIAAGRKLGAALIAFNEPHHFTPEEIARGEQAASHIALALAKARLVEGLETKVASRTADILAEQQKSESILRSVGDAILMTDLEMKVQYANDAYLALTGYTAKEIMGRPAGLLHGAGAPKRVRRAIASALADGRLWQGQVPCQRKDRRTYDAALTIAPLLDADGCLTGYVSSHQDISQSKKLDRARRQFMTNVSHQLRTPVTSIKLYAQMLQRDLPAEQTERYLQVMSEQADRLAHLIQDMLDMVTLDGGEVVTEWKPISLPRLIRNMLRRYHSMAQAAGLPLLSETPPPDLPAVNGDPMWLLRALGEVVENAITFTVMQDRDGGQITVAVDKTEDEGKPWVTLSVRDTGPGISPEEQEHIFDRFDRGRLAESGHIPGTGLGLSIAREILLAHGGRLTVQSELGKGSTFTLWLPSVPGEDPSE